MKFYAGAIKFDDIMNMPYSLFMMFYDYMIYLSNMETKEGQQRNKLEDAKLNEQQGISTIENDMLRIKAQFSNKIRK